jgi:plasmid maintenance system antidote protein VapI
MKQPKPINATLLAAIKKTGLTHYAIGQLAGVSPAGIDRFISGERGISLATAAKLCVALGLELRPAA